MIFRTPIRNNLRLLAAIATLAFLLFGLLQLLRKSRDFSPDFLASAVLYIITVLNFFILLVVLLILARNIVRILMERRRGIWGARLRMRLLLVFLVMTVAPSLLLLIGGSGLIQQTVDRWFSVDVERILSSSQALSAALRDVLATQTRIHARTVARELATRDLLADAGQYRLRRVVEARARQYRVDIISVHGPSGELVAVINPLLPALSYDRAAGDALVQVARRQGGEAERTVPFGAGELIQVAVVIGAGTPNPRGAVVAATFLRGELAAEAREVESRYSKLQQTRANRDPIKALYLSIYLLIALLALFGGVWAALYLASRITTPIRLVAQGAERIASGERGVRVSFPTGDDEFALLVASFNRMSDRLAHSEEEVELSRTGLTRKNQELEARQKLLETVLETLGTGVVMVDGEGAIVAINAAGSELLEVDGAIVGRRLTEALPESKHMPVVQMIARVLSGRVTRQQRELVLPCRSGDRHLLVTVVALPGVTRDTPAGAVSVLDDLTPLMRVQKVAAWGEVARKLAHEIKNPLTPIQLSAQRIRKAFLKNAPEIERIVTECTGTIVGEVDALRTLVDEFAQFARLPPVRLEPAHVNELVDETLALYDGLFKGVRFERKYARDLPPIPLDARQIKRVLINLIDNAIEALDKKGAIELSTQWETATDRLRIDVADNGPGIAPEDRGKLFVPSFSTKKRGSGLGLAIVSRIVQEHHGQIRVEANVPRGARFIVELPLASV
jgi:two-component system, NtrC family, nitrogen regulation sensor histidine kinase NtrY